MGRQLLGFRSLPSHSLQGKPGILGHFPGYSAVAEFTKGRQAIGTRQSGSEDLVLCMSALDYTLWSFAWLDPGIYIYICVCIYIYVHFLHAVDAHQAILKRVLAGMIFKFAGLMFLEPGGS